MKRKGDWIWTYTGRQFYPLDPRPEDVCIEDIAHHLAMKCRYSGATMGFYSVAEHSVHVSRYVPAEDAKWGLLHDAAEAYLADIPRPVKAHIPGWRKIERRVEKAVLERFGMSDFEPDAVRLIDTAILADEKAALFKTFPGRPWDGHTRAILGVEIGCWDPETARKIFLTRWEQVQ